LVNTWTTIGEIVKAMTCGGGRTIGNGFRRLEGTTIGIYMINQKTTVGIFH